MVQARQSTSTFSNDASFVGSFTMAPAGGDWRIWACATVRIAVSKCFEEYIYGCEYSSRFTSNKL